MPASTSNDFLFCLSRRTGSITMSLIAIAGGVLGLFVFIMEFTGIVPLNDDPRFISMSLLYYSSGSLIMSTIVFYAVITKQQALLSYTICAHCYLFCYLTMIGIVTSPSSVALAAHLSSTKHVLIALFIFGAAMANFAFYFLITWEYCKELENDELIRRRRSRVGISHLFVIPLDLNLVILFTGRRIPENDYYV